LQTRQERGQEKRRKGQVIFEIVKERVSLFGWQEIEQKRKYDLIPPSANGGANKTHKMCFYKNYFSAGAC
jgi:hypothetical protein